MLEQALSSGRVIDALLLLVIFEAVLISAYWMKTQRGVAPKVLLPMLGAGACLMMGIRSVLNESAVELLAFWLTGSLVFHLIDLHSRWKRGL